MVRERIVLPALWYYTPMALYDCMDELYYPVRLAEDKALLKQYVALARDAKRVSFVGRLGTYRYLGMHVVIGETLDLARECLPRDPLRQGWPAFSADPSRPAPQLAAALAGDART